MNNIPVDVFDLEKYKYLYLSRCRTDNTNENCLIDFTGSNTKYYRVVALTDAIYTRFVRRILLSLMNLLHLFRLEIEMLM